MIGQWTRKFFVKKFESFFNYGTLLVKLRLLTLDEISNVKELTLDSSDAFELKKKKCNFMF